MSELVDLALQYVRQKYAVDAAQDALHTAEKVFASALEAHNDTREKMKALVSRDRPTLLIPFSTDRFVYVHQGSYGTQVDILKETR